MLTAWRAHIHTLSIMFRCTPWFISDLGSGFNRKIFPLVASPNLRFWGIPHPSAWLVRTGRDGGLVGLAKRCEIVTTPAAKQGRGI